MLQILMLTYQGTTVRQLPHKKAELEQKVWAEYVKQMIAHKGTPTRYPRDRTISGSVAKNFE